MFYANLMPGSLQSEIQSHWCIIQSHNSKSDARLFTNYMPSSLPIVYKVFTSHTWLLEAQGCLQERLATSSVLEDQQPQANTGGLSDSGGLGSLSDEEIWPAAVPPQCTRGNQFLRPAPTSPASQPAIQHDCFQDCSPCSPRLLARSVDRPGLEARQTCSAPIGLQSLLGRCEALA